MALLYRLSLKSMMFGMKESESCIHRWDRVATGRRHPSLHMDVRFLACPIDEYTPHSPPCLIPLC